MSTRPLSLVRRAFGLVQNGISLVAYARTTVDDAGAEDPGLGDHNHQSYGIYICDGFAPNLADPADPNGTHTHSDGVIHIHPGAAQQVARTGEDVTMEDLGGALTHARTSGVAHFAADDEQACIADIRYLLSFLPPNNTEVAPYFTPLDRPDRMDDTTRTDDDLAAFFDSPDARHAALEARREAAPEPASVETSAAPLAGDDAELGSFFGSPDAPARPARRS